METPQIMFSAILNYPARSRCADRLRRVNTDFRNSSRGGVKVPTGGIRETWSPRAPWQFVYAKGQQIR
jgi:hypothetical protein